MSLRSRAILALALMIGFYLLAFGIVALLLYIPYAEWVYADRVTLRLAAFCVIGAGAIAKGIIPRRDKFVAPGPRLSAADQPKLFALVTDVSAATKQAMPQEVYLIPDVNAYVMERGGFMGFGSKRVMGVGLPLLATLSVPQFRAVVAHEFGHYDSGDTKLGPWIYKTRAAIGRTLESLSKHSGLLLKPFEWYGLGFLRITHAVSRRQEFVADAVAARVAGASTLSGGLRAIEQAGAGFASYWRSELAPVLERGFRPPVAVGFQMFVESPTVRPQLEAYLGHALESAKTDPYDTHPNLRDRLAALERLEPSSGRGATYDIGPDEPPALTLLVDVPTMEEQLIAGMLRKEVRVQPIAWTDVPAQVLPLGWQELTKGAQGELAGIKTSELPSIARLTKTQSQALADRLGLMKGSSQALEAAAKERAAHADAIVGAALALRLLARAKGPDSGVRLEAPPGEPPSFVVERDGTRLQILPFSLMDQLRAGDVSDEQWRDQASAAGVEEVSLADAPAYPAAAERPRSRLH